MDRVLSFLALLLLGFGAVLCQDEDRDAVSEFPTTDFSILPSEEDGGQLIPITWSDDNSTSNATEAPTGVSNLDGATTTSLNVTTDASKMTTESANVTSSTSFANSTSATTNTSATNASTSNSTSAPDTTTAASNSTATHVYTSVGVLVAAVVAAAF